MKKTDRLLEEIRETNLTYLMLAQKMIRADRVQALFRLGVTEEVADILENLSIAQILKIAASNMLMCGFRFSDEIVWNLLTRDSTDSNVEQVHAAILMAGAAAEAA
ncbi:MAG: flagellar transcriptional regulator FlhD [Burkholderiales bacterium]